MSEQPVVAKGQLWQRANGVIYVVEQLSGHVQGSRDVLLVPVQVPKGLRARHTWKYEGLVPCDLTRVDSLPATPKD